MQIPRETSTRPSRDLIMWLTVTIANDMGVILDPIFINCGI